jgi:hypothetical protein
MGAAVRAGKTFKRTQRSASKSAPPANPRPEFSAKKIAGIFEIMNVRHGRYSRGRGIEKPVKRSLSARRELVQPVSERDWDIIRTEGG